MEIIMGIFSVLGILFGLALIYIAIYKRKVSSDDVTDVFSGQADWYPVILSIILERLEQIIPAKVMNMIAKMLLFVIGVSVLFISISMFRHFCL